jgi:hypothetical protein
MVFPSFESGFFLQVEEKDYSLSDSYTKRLTSHQKTYELCVTDDRRHPNREIHHQYLHKNSPLSSSKTPLKKKTHACVLMLLSSLLYHSITEESVLSNPITLTQTQPSAPAAASSPSPPSSSSDYPQTH